MTDDVQWHAVSDTGSGGPAIVIPIDTIDQLSDPDIIQAIQKSIWQAKLASALSLADHLLHYAPGTDRDKIQAAEYLIEHPEYLAELDQFAEDDETVMSALLFAKSCIAFVAQRKEKQTKKRSASYETRSDMRRRYDETFVKIGRRDGFQCQQRGTSDGDLQIDHIYPVSKGGANDLSNLQLLCAACNLAKADRI